MKATDVIACLRSRWPASENVCVEEAPQKCDRGGRRIDLLAISTWRSRGLEIDAVEVKVSTSDWKRELDRAGKADFWWRHSHRFWIAVPKALATRVRYELPTGWGLIVCTPGADGEPGTSRVAVKAETREAEPLPWTTVVGVMRAAEKAGPTALTREFERGCRQGREAEKERGQRTAAHEGAAGELAALRATVERFEEASGVSVRASWYGSPIGDAVNMVLAEMQQPGSVLKAVKQRADNVVRSAEHSLKVAKDAAGQAGRLATALGGLRDPKPDLFTEHNADS